jgi:phosphatidylethanolamine/phosphatidyl-N-methylethanolamine N-methyltransferase
MALSRDQIEFIKAAIRNPLEVSTVFPTSRALAENLLAQADIRKANSVVELGAGTGAITQFLAPKLENPSRYLGVELDPKMTTFMRERFPKMRFETGLAEQLPEWVGPASVDVIVSSLPWSIFSDETQKKTLEAIRSSLRPGGVFTTYVCVNAMLYPQARAFIARLKSEFKTVEKSALEWRNIPPAYVFRAAK